MSNKVINMLDQLRSIDLDMGELDVTFEKDAAGNVTAEIYTDISNTPPTVLKRVDYVYDAGGNVLTETVTKGADSYRKTYTFNATGTIEKIEVRRVVGS